MDALGQTKLELIPVTDSECRIAERSGYGCEPFAVTGDRRERLHIAPHVLARLRAVLKHTSVRLSLMAAPITQRRCCAARTRLLACDQD